jgi:hypothetical protein
MRITQTTSQFTVCDDVLGDEDFKALQSYLQVEDYQWVHAARWHKVWGLQDGAPLMGPPVYSHCVNAEGKVYPTETHLDRLIDRLSGLQDDVLLERVGRFGEDWRAFGCRAYIYPQGAGLTWHADEMRYTGSFVYYGHSHWEAGWGGELLVADPACRIKFPKVDLNDPTARAMIESLNAGQYTDKAYLDSKLFESGIGTYILPKPNRLVVITAGNYHSIKRVEPAAGDHPRLSVAGFFMR